MAPQVQTFPWRETAAQLGGLLREGPLAADGRGGFVRAGDAAVALRFVPPAVLAPADGAVDAAAYARELPTDSTSADEALGVQGVLLLQAGAAAVGLWRGEELVDHKAFKRYVVRGSGKAQVSHLKTKGKSRYGSRLRLQNHRRLLEEVAERTASWWGGGRPPEHLFRAVPVRLWSEFLTLGPGAWGGARALGTTVRTPDFAELQRVRRWMLRGRIERVGDVPHAPGGGPDPVG